MSESRVFWFQGDDPDMIEANVNARGTFKYFWRECFWERQRIIPALDLAAVKAPFWDSEGYPDETEPVEHMWMTDIDFDGITVSGTLLNQPNQLNSVQEGDRVQIPLLQIDDWMYAVYERVYGAYTVNLMRSQMEPSERAAHDKAWGLDFGDPTDIEIFIRARPAPAPKKKGFLGRLLGKKDEAPPPSGEAEHDWKQEHAMSKNCGPGLADELESHPEVLYQTFDHGFTMLHMHALAGNLSCIPPLLAAGADPQARDTLGRTPAELATSQDWDQVATLLGS